MKHAQHHTKGRKPQSTRPTHTEVLKQPQPLVSREFLRVVQGALIGLIGFCAVGLSLFRSLEGHPGWWILAIPLFSFRGIVAGALIGSISVMTHATQDKTAIIGGVLGLAYAWYYVDGLYHPETDIYEGACYILIGLIIGWFTGRRQAERT